MSPQAKRLKFKAALAECTLHAEVLQGALRDWPAGWPEASILAPIDAPLRRALDQVAYRFMKLQDTLGERLLPGILDLAEEPLRPESTFAEQLQRLERLGALPSVQAWRLLREVRNSLAHEYPDQPALQAAAYARLRDAGGELLALWSAVQRFTAVRLGEPR